MPPPPPPPASEEGHRAEPRRRRGRQESNQLQVPADDSFRRESSFDASFERDGQLRSSHRPKEAENTSQYYGDTEDDELDAAQTDHRRKERKRAPEGDVTVSPPQTPRPARKISTSSYGSVSARPTRSVSFDDGYTPTMSHPPQRHKSRESLGSESSLHSTGYRVRSHSGASETSLSSNPLNHEPWRAKAAAQRPHSRSRRSRSQGEATYSANAGRRRRSRTPTAGDTNRLYQPRRSRSRGSLPDAPSRSAAPSQHSNSRDTSMLADDSFSDAYSHGYASGKCFLFPPHTSLSLSLHACFCTLSLTAPHLTASFHSTSVLQYDQDTWASLPKVLHRSCMLSVPCLLPLVLQACVSTCYCCSSHRPSIYLCESKHYGFKICCIQITHCTFIPVLGCLRFLAGLSYSARNVSFGRHWCS